MEQYTWEQFDNDVKQIVGWIKIGGYFDGIYGLPKGGLVLAVKLSYLTGLSLVLNKEEITKDTLVVDDISDTGKTLKEFKEKGCYIVTLFWHKQAITRPDFALREKKKDWIIFPWEE